MPPNAIVRHFCNMLLQKCFCNILLQKCHRPWQFCNMLLQKCQGCITKMPDGGIWWHFCNILVQKCHRLHPHSKNGPYQKNRTRTLFLGQTPFLVFIPTPSSRVIPDLSVCTIAHKSVALLFSLSTWLTKTFQSLLIISLILENRTGKRIRK